MGKVLISIVTLVVIVLALFVVLVYRDRIYAALERMYLMGDFEWFDVDEEIETAPESVDWRDRGVVTPVRDQGQCGSCWAFATTYLLEALHKNRTGELVELSPQYLLDCSDYSYVREDRCTRGNEYIHALTFVKANGMFREEEYAYTGRVGECNRTRTPTVLHAIDLMFIWNDEKAMKEALHRYGPLVTFTETTPYKNYTGGVFSDEHCNGGSGHALLIIGYGTDPAHGPYWIVKNSWGEDWGEAGYMRITQDEKKNCGISSIVFFVK